MSDVLLGGWTAFDFELSTEARAVFDSATRSLLGVKYSAFAVASQIVAGTNYSYLARAQVVSPGAPLRVVRVHIFQPLPGQGEPHVTQIIDIQP